MAQIEFLSRVVREALRSGGLPESGTYPSGIKKMPYETGGFQLTLLADRVRVFWVSARSDPGQIELGRSRIMACLAAAGLRVDYSEGAVDVLPD